jgi:RNA polymerase sigma-70 factor (ECF subfamily)
MQEKSERPTLVSALQVVPMRTQDDELETAFRTYRTSVFRAAYRVTGNAADAEDVLQTVFLRFARREDDASEVGNLKSYLYRAAVNAALDLLRSRQASRLEPLEDTSAVTPGQLHEDLVLRTWLRSAISKLNPRHAEMFVLRYIEDYDNREIARLMKTSQGVVAITLFRIRKQLQKDFKSQTGAQAK